MGRPFDFAGKVKDEAYFRQRGLCALCGRSLRSLIEHAHHVVPNQAGVAGNPGHRWLRTAVNCVVLCDECHEEVHGNGDYRKGGTKFVEDFKYSHGKDRAGHERWVSHMHKIVLSVWPDFQPRIGRSGKT